jgi:hypothetical protein
MVAFRRNSIFLTPGLNEFHADFSPDCLLINCHNHHLRHAILIPMALKRRKQSAKRSIDGQSTARQAVVSTEGPEEQFTDQSSQDLKFVDVTPRYLQGTRNPAEQKSIRVHVMQDFLRQRKQLVDAVEPPAMAGTVSSHVHRFRIAKPRLPGDKPVGTMSSQKVAMCSEQSRRSTPPRTSSTTIGGSRDRPESETVVLASADQPSHCGTLLAEERTSASPPRISPILPGVMARMDPFARFPIDASIETHGILDYCEQHVLLSSATLQGRI